MKRPLAALLAGAAAAFALVALPLTDASAATGCRVDYTPTGQWSGGFQSDVRITNLGSPITGWSLGFDFADAGQHLSQGWNATWSQAGSKVTATSADWNASLGTNASVSIGFTGTSTGANPVPAGFTLNGVACTGTTDPTTPPPTTPPPTTPPPTTPPAGTTPVAINGRLHVCGVNLCNQYDKPVQLRGVSTHGLQWFGDCYKAASLDALANDWKADLLRVSMYVQEGGYETDPAGFTNQVNNIVDLAAARGMYALIDFHTLTPGDPNYNLERAKTFFAAVSARNAGKNNVLYEIANEPNGVSWASIKGYAEQVIPVIRANDPGSVVVVGTRGWSSLGVSEGGNETEVINNPVNAQNVMYTFHFYAASHGDAYRDAVRRAAARIPLFVTEFGTVDYTGSGPFDQASSTTWLDLLDSLKISYANWTFSDAGESSAALLPGTCAGSNFSGTDILTASGKFIRSRIMTPDNFPTS
ncbi:cellulase family glycosylhydrolase [Streptomyces sp. CA-111067]|uniref:cellulase family glycosylhydrolase n=1 Tax=Streptomyces sp. CA-111067 TaxID=3240046 RepID=UPI003D9683F8